MKILLHAIFNFVLLSMLASNPVRAEPGESNSNAASAPPVEQKPAPEVISGVTGDLVLPASQSQTGIYLEFLNSPKLTDALRQSLAQRGLNMIQSPSVGAIRIDLKGTYSATRGTYQSFSGDVGRLFEKAAGPEKVDLEVNSYARRTVPNTILAGATAGMMAKGSLSFTSGFLNIGELLSDATGFRGWFNEKLFGNPSGFCLFNCGSKENRVNQNVQIETTLTIGGEESRILSEAHTITDEFVPDLLIQKCLDKTVIAIR